MKKIIDAFGNHAPWVMGLALVIYAIDGLYLGKSNFGSMLPDLLGGAGLLGLHLKTQ